MVQYMTLQKKVQIIFQNYNFICIIILSSSYFPRKFYQIFYTIHTIWTILTSISCIIICNISRIIIIYLYHVLRILNIIYLIINFDKSTCSCCFALSLFSFASIVLSNIPVFVNVDIEKPAKISNIIIVTTSAKSVIAFWFLYFFIHTLHFFCFYIILFHMHVLLNFHLLFLLYLIEH